MSNKNLVISDNQNKKVTTAKLRKSGQLLFRLVNLRFTLKIFFAFFLVLQIYGNRQ